VRRTRGGLPDLTSQPSDQITAGVTPTLPPGATDAKSRSASTTRWMPASLRPTTSTSPAREPAPGSEVVARALLAATGTRR